MPTLSYLVPLGKKSGSFNNRKNVFQRDVKEDPLGKISGENYSFSANSINEISSMNSFNERFNDER